MIDIKTLAASQKAKLAGERERNRAKFPLAAQMQDALIAGGISSRVVYAENAKGETIGKRDHGPWIDGDLIVRAADWNARVYRRTA